MNICLLTPTFPPKLGGLEVVASSLAEHFHQLGHNVVVVTQWPRTGKGNPDDNNSGYRVVRYRRPWSFSFSMGMRSITRTLSLSHSESHFDLIHAHMAYPTGAMAVKFGHSRNIPVVITSHGSDIRTTSRYRQRKLIWNRIRDCIREADAVTAISEDMENLLREIAGTDREIVRIPNGVNLSDIRSSAVYESSWPISENEKFVLYLGGLTHKKGVDILLSAMAIALVGVDPRACPDTNSKEGNHRGLPLLVIAGDGVKGGDLKDFAIKNGLDNHVIFAGRVEGNFKRYLLQNCRYLVIPSLTESFGLVALEAFSCGKPILSSNVGELKSLLSENSNLGRMIQAGDVKGLADAMMDMDESKYSPELISKFSENYDWKNVCRQYLKLYQRIIL